MYLLMSAFHLVPWLKLISRQRLRDLRARDAAQRPGAALQSRDRCIAECTVNRAPGSAAHRAAKKRRGSRSRSI